MAAVLFGTTSMFAQGNNSGDTELKSKKGEHYLPEEGDYAIGMDAVPFLNYIGNFFGKTGPNDASNIWLPNNTNLALSAKYFYKEDMAFRVGLRLGFGSTTTTNRVADLYDNSTTNPWPALPSEVENKMKSGYTAVGLNLGVEYRRGSTRLQGFYGAEIGFMIQSNSEKFTYGNAIDATHPVNSADNFGGAGNVYAGNDGIGNPIQIRDLTRKSGIDFGLGLRAFAGAEYFVLPKLSLGGEIGWGLGLNISGKTKLTAEAVGTLDGSTSASVQTIEREGVSSTDVGVESSLFNPIFGPVGRLNIIFHF